MVGWPHWLNGHEFEQTLGDGEGQGSVACCSPWAWKELNMTEKLNNKEQWYRKEKGLFYVASGRIRTNGWKFSSIQFSHLAMSSSLWPHEPQHARPPSPSPTLWVHPNPCPLSQWCHPAISSSVIPFSSHPQSFSASESFQMSQLFASGGQSIGVPALASVLPVNT